MKDAFIIFVAQYSTILLLGLQSLNVNKGHKILAALTSLMLGVSGFFVTGIVAKAYNDGMFTLVWWAFIIAGPLGITSSMTLHPVIVKWMKK
jgi:cation transporter-like permease